MNYQRKTKPALWMDAFPEQVRPKASNRKQIKSRTKDRAKEEALYRSESAEWLRNVRRRGDKCPVVASIPELRQGCRYGWPTCNRITEVHHMRGRAGTLLRDKRFWLGVSKAGHRWIHSHVAEARRRGWICAAGQWNCLGK